MNRSTMSKRSRMHNLRKAKLQRIDRKYAQMERAIERQYNRHRDVIASYANNNGAINPSIQSLIEPANAYKLPTEYEMARQEREWLPDEYAVIRRLIPRSICQSFKSLRLADSESANNWFDEIKPVGPFPMTLGEAMDATSDGEPVQDTPSQKAFLEKAYIRDGTEGYNKALRELAYPEVIPDAGS